MFSTLICRFWMDSRSRRASRASWIEISLWLKRRIGQHLAQGAFQLAHVGAHVLGHEEGHVFGHVGAFGCGLVDQDGHAHFELRGLDGHRQAGVEAARSRRSSMSAKPFGVGVAGHDDV
jgi:hypothetical protein